MVFFDWVLYILIAVGVLLLMITIHEAGHYTAGKILKFKINEFSIGFGKPIYKHTKKSGEVFAIRMLPLGGFCAFEGEDEDKPASEGAFNNQPVWKRLIVLFMGPFFNFLSALVFSVFFLTCYGYADKIQIKNVELPESYTLSAQEWLMEDDIVTAVNGVKCDFVTDSYFVNMVANYKYGDTFTITVQRNGEEVVLENIYKDVWSAFESKGDENYVKRFALDGENYNYAVRYDGTSKYQLLKLNGNSVEETYDIADSGIVVVGEETYKANITLSDETDKSSIVDVTLSRPIIGVETSNYRYGFFEALGYTFVFCIKWAWKILVILWQLISFQLPISNIGGTIATVVTVAEATHRSFANLMLLFPLISINLAVFNLLPFPALDGARMVFVGIEGVRGKPINRKVEGMIHFIGLMVLLAFVLVVDILHFVL